MGEDDVRRERGQFGCVSANVVGIDSSPTNSPAASPSFVTCPVDGRGKETGADLHGHHCQFTNSTVRGFGNHIFDTLRAEMQASTTEVLIKSWSMYGSLDRITGSMTAYTASRDSKTGVLIDERQWHLICKPTKPLF
jgi:hypothetical protein